MTTATVTAVACETNRPGADCHNDGTELVMFGRNGRQDSRLLCPSHAREEATEGQGIWVGSSRPRRSR